MSESRVNSEDYNDPLLQMGIKWYIWNKARTRMRTWVELEEKIQDVQRNPVHNHFKWFMRYKGSVVETFSYVERLLTKL